MTVLTDYYKDFALLLEHITNPGQPSVLNEDSTLLNSPIAQNPGGRELISYLHRKGRLAHNVEYKSVRPRDLVWSSLKEISTWSWVFFLGDKNTVAVRSGGKSKNFIVVFVDQDTISLGKEFQKSTEMLKYVKEHAGNIKEIYMGSDTSERIKKSAERRQLKKPQTIDIIGLLNKFRPLILKSSTAALANVKGHAMDSIKNDSMEQARKYIEVAKKLRETIDSIEYHADEYDYSGNIYLRTAINNAKIMTASYYYPEETGRIQKSYSNDYSASGNGPNKVLQDIANGDQEKLGTLLYYFKRALVTI